MIIWIMGLNGAGKSSIARELEALFIKQQRAAIILDGNHMREIFEQKSYDRASRIALGIRYANLAKSLSSKDNVIIIAANGMLSEVCDYNRTHLPHYIEVFLDVPLEILKKRDSGGIYSRFERGLVANVGGLDLEIDVPNPHIHIPYTPTQSPKDIAAHIFALATTQPSQAPKPHMPNPLLSTKAQTLKNLSGKLKYGKILPLWILTKDEFESPSTFQTFLKELESSPFERFVVRSSSSSEDTSLSSNAGAYESLLDVGVGEMGWAIKRVFASYERHSVLSESCGSSEKSLHSFMSNKLPCDFSYNPQASSQALECQESLDFQNLTQDTRIAGHSACGTILECQELLDFQNPSIADSSTCHLISNSLACHSEAIAEESKNITSDEMFRSAQHDKICESNSSLLGSEANEAIHKTKIKVDSEVANAVGQPTASNQSREVPTQSRPFSGAEHWEEGGSSATANAELERDKRGYPLNPEKVETFSGLRGAGEGINPFLRNNENSKLDSELSKDISATSQYDKVCEFSVDSQILESGKPTNTATQNTNSSIADEVRGLSKNCAEASLTTKGDNSKILSENTSDSAAGFLGDFCKCGFRLHKGCQVGGEGVTLKVMTEADNADFLKSGKTRQSRSFFSKKPTHQSEEVLIQPMAPHILASGVCFNTQPKTNAPYYVIEYSLESTHAITAGESRTKTFYIAHYDDVEIGDFDDPYIPRILKLMREIESLIPNTPLDMEFGLSQNESYCFQVRPLILKESRIYPSHKTQLTLIQEKIEQILKPHIRLYGQRGILGVMPDWNPAEIIGLHPRALALSLYTRLITDSMYARERARYGYKDVSANPLIFSLHGKPYVDVRASFNSFLPNSLRAELSQKLTDYYLNQLRANPQWHDKVEFEILFDSYYFDTPKRLKKLLSHGFNQHEIDELQAALNALTHNIIKDKIYLHDIAKVEKLAKNREQILGSNAPLLEKIYWLLQDCQHYGTSAFVGLARMGFMAMGFLNALVKEGILNKEQKDSFITSLECITTSLSKDLSALDREDFLRKYGHLRPGTYDILSPRYDEHFEFYFKSDSKVQHKPPLHEHKESFALTLSQMKDIDALLQSHNIGCDVIGLFDFIAMGIIHRESSKFEFSKNLSEALRLIGKLGKSYGLSIEDMSYCDVDIFFKAYSTSSNLERLILESIESNKSAHEIQEGIILPPLVCSPKDVLGFYILESMPNFITQKRVSAPVVLLDESALGGDSKSLESALHGKIVCISRADPGFDWLFSHSIVALITEFGGANSHMAIRANELGIPAIIGCGEKFSLWANAKSLEIDCANSKVEILS